MSINSIVILWRFGHYYSINENLGPKVCLSAAMPRWVIGLKLIMVQRMLLDLAVFIALVLLVLIGFGIAAQGVSANREPFDVRTFTSIFYRFE
jgi:hypothetical protein